MRPPSGTGSLCSALPSRQSKSWSARAPRCLIEGRITSHEYQDKKGESRRVTEIVVAGPQGRVNVLSPRQDDGRAEDVEGMGEVVGNGDPSGTTGASAPAGEPDGAAPDGPSGLARQL